MCGIYGYAGFSEPGLSARMNATLWHRGPDSGGDWQSPGGEVTLGNRRLKIIDLSDAGRMPMSNEDGSVWITYNGEVYNARDLRAQLDGRHRFRSHTDTEILVHAYEEWGDEFVSRLRGMFAFALWDGPRRRLLLARDRFAQKPFYYWRDGGELVFASEIRALLCAPRIARRPDLTALRDYVCFRYVQGTRTGLDGIHSLPAGHLAVWEAGALSTHRYWSLPHSTVEPGGDWRAEARAAIEESVRLRLISDVPVGMMLSGGLDSSLILALACRHENAHLRSFTAAFAHEGEDQPGDEVELAARTAAFLQSAHEVVRIPAPSAADLRALAIVIEEPLADASSWPTWLIARQARASGMTVLLSGEGADELFWGYPRYRALAFSERHPASRHPWMAPLLRPALRLAGRPGLGVYLSSSSLARRNYLAAGGLPGAGLSQLYPGLAADGEPDSEYDLPAPGSVHQRAARWDLEHWLARDILTRVDKTTMAASIEGRAPFLDVRIAEMAARLPDRLKLRAGQDKPVLRHLADAYLPPEIRATPKRPFRSPLRQWLQGAAGGLLCELVEDSDLTRQGIVAAAPARRLAAAALAGDAPPQAAWNLLSLLTWHAGMIQGER